MSRRKCCHSCSLRTRACGMRTQCYLAGSCVRFWGMPFSGNMTDYSPYMRLYNASAQAIKAVHPELKVGGPSSNGGVCCIESVSLQPAATWQLAETTWGLIHHVANNGHECTQLKCACACSLSTWQITCQRLLISSLVISTRSRLSTVLANS